MKKTILTIAIVIMASHFTTVFAQSTTEATTERVYQMSPEERALKQTERMKKQLALNETQVKEIYEINLKQNQKREALKVQKNAIRTEYKSGLNKVLTEEQKVKLKAIKAEHEHGDHNKHHKGQVPPPPPPKK